MKFKENVKVYSIIDLSKNGVEVVVGTIEDVRNFGKNLWGFGEGKYVNDCLKTNFIEEDYYLYLDDDENLMDIIHSLGYFTIEKCKVPFEDFIED